VKRSDVEPTSAVDCHSLVLVSRRFDRDVVIVGPLRCAIAFDRSEENFRNSTRNAAMSPVITRRAELDSVLLTLWSNRSNPT